MKPVEKVLGRLECVVESEGVVRFRIALKKSGESEVSVLTKNYALAMQKYQGYEKAAELAPEPDSCNDTAIVRNTEEVSDVDHRPDGSSGTTYPAALEFAKKTHKTRRHNSLLERANQWSRYARLRQRSSSARTPPSTYLRAHTSR